MEFYCTVTPFCCKMLLTYHSTFRWVLWGSTAPLTWQNNCEYLPKHVGRACKASRRIIMLQERSGAYQYDDWHSILDRNCDTCHPHLCMYVQARTYKQPIQCIALKTKYPQILKVPSNPKAIHKPMLLTLLSWTFQCPLPRSASPAPTVPSCALWFRWMGCRCFSQLQTSWGLLLLARGKS